MNNFINTLKIFAVEQCFDTLMFGKVCDDCHGQAIFKLIATGIQVLTAGIFVLATIGFIWAGVLYLTARDDEAQVAKAKKRMFEVVIGLVIYSFMFIIGNLLIPGGLITDYINTSGDTCPDAPVATPTTPGTPAGGGGGSSPSPSTPAKQPSYPDNYTPVAEGKTKTVSILGSTWTVPNTKYDLLEYDKSLKKHKVAQDSQTCTWSGSCSKSTADNDKCMSFAETFAYDLYYGTTTSDVQAPKWARSYYVNKSIKEDSLDKTLAVIYNQLNGGFPVVAQVSYNADFSKKNNTRHFITVVGYRSSVKSFADLKVDDLLILNTNGKIQPATAKGSGKAWYGGSSSNASYLPLVPGSITPHRNSYTGYYLRMINTSRSNHKIVDKH